MKARRDLPIDPEAIADRLAYESELLYDRCLIRGRSLWSVWQSYNDQNNPLRDAVLPRSRGASIIDLLAQSALHETIMIVTRALDTAGRGGIFNTNRISFPVLLALTEADGVRDEVAERARRWYPDRFGAEENAALVLGKIGNLQSTLTRLTNETPNRGARLRQFRDEFLAHNLAFEDERERPVIGDVTTLLDEITAMTEDALLAFKGQTLVWDTIDDIMRTDAEVLWNTIRAGASR